MRLPIAVVSVAAALSAMAYAGAAVAAVEIRDAVARVTVIPEDRVDVKVELLATNKSLPLDIRTSGASTIIDGGLGHRIWSCGHGHDDQVVVNVRGIGQVDYADMPQVVIHTPQAVSVESGGVVFGVIGRSASLDLANSGCGRWTVADVVGDATVRDSGVSFVKMGSTGRLDLRISGAGDLHVTHVQQGMQVVLSGAGGVTIDDLAGPLQARVSGAGKVRVLSGHAATVRASVSGIGAVDFGGQADSLDASISGMGDIRVKSVSGPVNKSITGIGRVTIGD